MMLCQRCRGQMLRQPELDEPPYFKCLQCSRVVYATVAEPALPVKASPPSLSRRPLPSSDRARQPLKGVNRSSART